MSVQLIRSNFTAGELSPLMYGRVTFAKYQNGLEKARNVLILSQGGITNRFGTIFEAETTANYGTDFQIYILNYDNINKYLVIHSDRKIEVYLNGTLKATITTSHTKASINQFRVKQDGTKLEFVHEDYKPAILARDASDDTSWTFTDVIFRNEPTFDFARDYDSLDFILAAKSGYDVSLKSTADFFSSRHVGGLVEASGVYRITTLVSGTEVKGNIISPFEEDSLVFGGKDCYIGEPIFSSLRGWPRTLDFYQGRQWYGGTKILKNGIFGSATFDAFNYDDSGVTASDSISVIISELENNNVEFLTHNKDLFVLTDNAEYSTPPFSDKPASPENTYFIMQNDHGVSNLAPPTIIDNSPIVIDRGGKFVRIFQYSVQSNKYIAKNISILSPHLIRNPVSAAVFKNPAINDAIYLLLVNGDGTLAIFHYIEDEEIAAWALSSTDGTFMRVAASGSDVYVVVERVTTENSNPINKLYIEKISFDILLDSAKDQTFGSPQTVIGGLAHLDGKTVTVLADDFLQDSKIVVDGQITIDTAATHVIIGLPIEWEARPLPVEYMTEEGNNRYLKKRIRTVYLDYYESLGIKIDGLDIPTLNFGDGYFGQPLVPRSEIYEYTPMDSWERTQSITISGDKPFRFNIRSITFGVEQ